MGFPGSSIVHNFARLIVKSCVVEGPLWAPLLFFADREERFGNTQVFFNGSAAVVNGSIRSDLARLASGSTHSFTY